MSDPTVRTIWICDDEMDDAECVDEEDRNERREVHGRHLDCGWWRVGAEGIYRPDERMSKPFRYWMERARVIWFRCRGIEQ